LSFFRFGLIGYFVCFDVGEDDHDAI